jgi:hypothetical protein
VGPDFLPWNLQEKQGIGEWQKSPSTNVGSGLNTGPTDQL